MMKRSLAALIVVSASSGSAYGVTGNTVVYDDQDQNAFNRYAAACGFGSFINQSGAVHSGSMAMAVTRNDNDGVGWAGTQVYSTASDYDGVEFWFNAGNIATTITSFGVSDGSGDMHYLHLEDIYGGSLPAATWIRFAIPFSSPYFQSNGYTPPASFGFFCVINHTSSAQQNFMYVDDVTLTGADIFENGFES
jgi:hypothetical protein